MTASHFITDGRKYAVSQCASNTSMTAITYENAVVVSSKNNVNVMLNYSERSTTHIGAAWHGGNRVFSGTIHSLRVYSRQLSEEEVKHNYAVDKERYLV